MKIKPIAVAFFIFEGNKILKNVAATFRFYDLPLGDQTSCYIMC